MDNKNKDKADTKVDACDEGVLIATGGFPTDTIIVRPNAKGDPEVGMFFLDAKQQIFWVFYGNGGVVSFDVENYEEIAFHPDQFDHICKMAAEAKQKWIELDKIRTENQLW